MAKMRARYPSVPLDNAVQRVEQIYNREGSNYMDSAVAVQHMGYTSISGASLKALASLKKYGLLEGRGDEIRVTEDAITIVADKGLDDQGERGKALFRAFSSDEIFKELYERFGRQTTELNISSYLKKKGFMPASATKAAKTYFDSLEFITSELGSYDTIDSNDDDQDWAGGAVVEGYVNQTLEDVKSASIPNKQIASSGRMESLPIPIGMGRTWPTLLYPANFGEDEYQEVIDYLTYMKSKLYRSNKLEITSDDKGNESAKGLPDLRK